VIHFPLNSLLQIARDTSRFGSSSALVGFIILMGVISDLPAQSNYPPESLPPVAMPSNSAPPGFVPLFLQPRFVSVPYRAGFGPRGMQRPMLVPPAYLSGPSGLAAPSWNMPAPNAQSMPIPASVITNYGPALPPNGTPLPQVASDAVSRFAQTYPLCVIISEAFANSFVNKTTYDQTPVRENVLGAEVYGQQQTSATSRVDFVSNPIRGQLNIILDGTTQNYTTSYTSQAAVQTRGQYQFHLNKQVDFDGRQFTTRSPSALMSIEQQNVGAITPASGVPVIGSVANMVAINVASQRMPMARRIAAQRLTQRVAPRFNTETDSKLNDLNQLLEDPLRSRLEEFNVAPTRHGSMTTDTLLVTGFGLTEQTRVETSIPEIDPSASIQVLMHETHLNDVIGKFPIGGLEIPDTMFERLGRLKEIGIAGMAALPPATPKLATLVLDADQPISARIEDGAIQYELRTEFRPIVGPLVPTQRITIELRPRIEHDSFTMVTELVSVEPLNPGGDPLFTQIVEKAIEQQIQNIPQMNFPISYTVPLKKRNEQMDVRLTKITAQNGWLSLAFTASKPTPIPVVMNRKPTVRVMSLTPVHTQ